MTTFTDRLKEILPGLTRYEQGNLGSLERKAYVKAVEATLYVLASNKDWFLSNGRKYIEIFFDSIEKNSCTEYEVLC